jgi:hypothetical protein
MNKLEPSYTAGVKAAAAMRLRPSVRRAMHVDRLPQKRRTLHAAHAAARPSHATCTLPALPHILPMVAASHAARMLLPRTLLTCCLAREVTYP